MKSKQYSECQCPTFDEMNEVLNLQSSASMNDNLQFDVLKRIMMLIQVRRCTKEDHDAVKDQHLYTK